MYVLPRKLLGRNSNPLCYDSEVGPLIGKQVRGGALMNGISALLKDSIELSLPFFHVKTQGKDGP